MPDQYNRQRQQPNLDYLRGIFARGRQPMAQRPAPRPMQQQANPYAQAAQPNPYAQRPPQANPAPSPKRSGNTNLAASQASLYGQQAANPYAAASSPTQAPTQAPTQQTGQYDRSRSAQQAQQAQQASLYGAPQKPAAPQQQPNMYANMNIMGTSKQSNPYAYLNSIASPQSGRNADPTAQAAQSDRSFGLYEETNDDDENEGQSKSMF